MLYPIEARGFESGRLALESASLTRGHRLLLDGAPVPKGPKRNQFLLRRPDGTEAIATLHPVLFDIVPQVELDGMKLRLVEPLRWYQWLWMLLPVAPLFSAGALGVIILMSALLINLNLFRSARSRATQYGLSALVSVGALLLFGLIVVALQLLVNGT